MHVIEIEVTSQFMTWKLLKSPGLLSSSAVAVSAGDEFVVVVNPQSCSVNAAPVIPSSLPDTLVALIRYVTESKEVGGVPPVFKASTQTAP